MVCIALTRCSFVATFVIVSVLVMLVILVVVVVLVVLVILVLVSTTRTVESYNFVLLVKTTHCRT